MYYIYLYNYGIILFVMKEFYFTYGSESEVPVIYLGQYNELSKTYAFIKKDDNNDAVSFKILNDGVHLSRQGNGMVLQADLYVNRVCSISLTLNNENLKGELPVLVRKIDINYPRELDIVYQILDEKNIPIETIEILISEKV